MRGASKKAKPPERRRGKDAFEDISPAPGEARDRRRNGHEEYEQKRERRRAAQNLQRLAAVAIEHEREERHTEQQVSA